MATTRLRPRCRITSDKPTNELLEKIKKSVKKHSDSFEGEIVQEHAFIRIPKAFQHYWTPELHVWIREQDGESVVYGVMGPKPKIWTMFMFLYVGVITSTFLGGTYGIIQMWLGMDAPFLWSIPLGILGMAFVFGAAQYGQYKGRKQMEILKGFLYDTVEEED